MKKTIVLSFFTGMALTFSTHATVQTLPFTDHFPYSDGNLYSVATGVWDAGGSAGTEFTVSNSAALTAPTNFAVASAKGVKWQPSGTARRNIVQFTSQSSGEVYASFLINNATPPGSSRLIAYLENIAGSTVSSPQLGIFLNGSTLGIGKKATAPAVTTTLSSGTHLVVVRYTFLSGDDQADLWLDPPSSTYGATNAPGSLGSTTGSSDPTTIQYFAFNGTSGSGPVVYYDEVRIGTNWADVTPSSGTPPPPPPATNVVTVTQALWDPAGFIIRGTGGTATGLYEILSATDIGTPLSNWVSLATNQFDAVGNFDCTNPVSPSDPQRFYCLRIDTNAPPPPPPPPPGAPGIVSQPQNLTVLEGQTAVFSVIATGTPPLVYQWYFNTNSTVANATNSTLTIQNAQISDAGMYSATVSNAAASVSSSYASLAVVSSSTPNFDMIGFATLDGGTTGGSGGATTTVSNATALEAALNMSVPLIVQIQGNISIGTIDSKPNKTIIGLGADAGISGNLKLTHTSNIIVRNITFHNSGDDLLTIQQSSHIWVDHCTFIDAGDGELDITHASEWVTISWCKFYYTFNSGHNFVNLIGHDDDNAAEDTGHLHITWHHNWWGPLCIERMPRVRFGQVHSFNNYFNASINDVVTNSYCVRAAIGSQLFIENNFFEKVRTPWKVYITTAGGPDGLICATNNNVGYLDTSYGVVWGTTTTNSDHTIDVMVPGTNTVFTPPYSYGLNAALDVPSIVTNNAGAAKGPFAP
jgi:pectate lyase